MDNLSPVDVHNLLRYLQSFANVNAPYGAKRHRGTSIGTIDFRPGFADQNVFHVITGNAHFSINLVDAEPQIAIFGQDQSLLGKISKANAAQHNAELKQIITILDAASQHLKAQGFSGYEKSCSEFMRENQVRPQTARAGRATMAARPPIAAAMDSSDDDEAEELSPAHQAFSSNLQTSLGQLAAFFKDFGDRVKATHGVTSPNTIKIGGSKYSLRTGVQDKSVLHLEYDNKRISIKLDSAIPEIRFFPQSKNGHNYSVESYPINNFFAYGKILETLQDALSQAGLNAADSQALSSNLFQLKVDYRKIAKEERNVTMIQYPKFSNVGICDKHAHCLKKMSENIGALGNSMLLDNISQDLALQVADLTTILHTISTNSPHLFSDPSALRKILEKPIHQVHSLSHLTVSLKSTPSQDGAKTCGELLESLTKGTFIALHSAERSDPDTYDEMMPFLQTALNVYDKDKASDIVRMAVEIEPSRELAALPLPPTRPSTAIARPPTAARGTSSASSSSASASTADPFATALEDAAKRRGGAKK